MTYTTGGDEMTRQCEKCGSEYTPKAYWQRWCSKYCAYRGWWDKNHPVKRPVGRPRKVRPDRLRSTHSTPGKEGTIPS